jgi:hypothetical protein
MWYVGERNTEVKNPKFLKVTGLINKIFKPPKVQKHTRIKIYILDLLTHSYRNENWTVKAKDKRQNHNYSCLNEIHDNKKKQRRVEILQNYGNKIAIWNK